MGKKGKQKKSESWSVKKLFHVQIDEDDAEAQQEELNEDPDWILIHQTLDPRAAWWCNAREEQFRFYGDPFMVKIYHLASDDLSEFLRTKEKKAGFG